jgi:hypothetical protein
MERRVAAPEIFWLASDLSRFYHSLIGEISHEFMNVFVTPSLESRKVSSAFAFSSFVLYKERYAPEMEEILFSFSIWNPP